MYICKYCGKECKSKMSLIKHELYCDLNPNKKSKDIFKKNAEKTNKILKEKAANKHKFIYKIVCPRCGKTFDLELFENEYLRGKYRKYCSSSCANARIHTTETKNKISKTLIYGLNRVPKLRICKCCGKEYVNIKISGSTRIFCSKECSAYERQHRKDFLSRETLNKLSRGGRKSCNNQFNLRRSRAEVYFCELCKSKFNNVLTNQAMFNEWDADIILPDYKIAILYNGPWHYKEISKKVSLAQIQNRDDIKIKEIEKCGYTPYIVKDLGKFKKKYVEEQFELFIKYMNSNYDINII